MENKPLGMIGTLWWLWCHWDTIVQNWQLVVQAFIGLVGAVVTLASIITPLTSTPKDDEALAWLKNWLHQFAFTNPKDIKGIGAVEIVQVPAPQTSVQNIEITKGGQNASHIQK